MDNPEGTGSSRPPEMGLTEARVRFYFRFSDKQKANTFRAHVNSEISGVALEATGEEVSIDTDIASFSQLKEQIDRFSNFIRATRPAVQASLAS